MGGVGAVSAARKRMTARRRRRMRLIMGHPTSGINVRANIPRLSWEMQTEGGECAGGGRMRPPLHELIESACRHCRLALLLARSQRLPLLCRLAPDSAGGRLGRCG